MPRHLIGQYQVKIINDGIKGHGPIEICEDEKSFGPYIIRRYIFFFCVRACYDYELPCRRIWKMNLSW
jgi:hypothetical protein